MAAAGQNFFNDYFRTVYFNKCLDLIKYKTKTVSSMEHRYKLILMLRGD